MMHYSIRELDETTLRRIRAIACGANQIYMIPTDDVVVPILQVEPEHGVGKDFTSGPC